MTKNAPTVARFCTVNTMLLRKTGRYYDYPFGLEQVLEIYAIKGGYNFRDKSRNVCGSCYFENEWGDVAYTIGLNPGDTVLYQYDSGNYNYLSNREFEENSP